MIEMWPLLKETPILPLHRLYHKLRFDPWICQSYGLYSSVPVCVLAQYFFGVFFFYFFIFFFY